MWHSINKTTGSLICGPLTVWDTFVLDRSCPRWLLSGGSSFVSIGKNSLACFSWVSSSLLMERTSPRLILCNCFCKVQSLHQPLHTLRKCKGQNHDNKHNLLKLLHKKVHMQSKAIINMCKHFYVVMMYNCICTL